MIFGTIDVMMPGFRYVGDVDLEVEGTKAKFAIISVISASATGREKVRWYTETYTRRSDPFFKRAHCNFIQIEVLI